jgi:hypothetical protein
VNVRWISLGTVAGAAIVLLAVGSCTSDSGTTIDDAYLRDRLLTAATLPTGMQLVGGPDDDSSTGDTPAAAPNTAVPCSDLGHALSVVRAAAAPAASAHILIEGTTADRHRWDGGEQLLSMRKGGAAKAFTNVRSIVHRCPRSDPSAAGEVDDSDPLTTSFTIVPGPPLGDESIRLQSRTSSQHHPGVELESDVILIRSGSIVLVVYEVPAIFTPSGPSRLDEFAAAAFTRLRDA